MKIGIVLRTQDGDWEGLFVDGVLISEGHELNEPQEWVDWTNKHGLVQVKFFELNDFDNSVTNDYGCLPEWSKLTGDYK